MGPTEGRKVMGSTESGKTHRAHRGCTYLLCWSDSIQWQKSANVLSYWLQDNITVVVNNLYLFINQVWKKTLKVEKQLKNSWEQLLPLISEMFPSCYLIISNTFFVVSYSNSSIAFRENETYNTHVIHSTVICWTWNLLNAIFSTTVTHGRHIWLNL